MDDLRDLPVPHSKTIPGILTVLAAVILPAGGCTSSKWANLRSAPQNPLVERLQLSSYSGPQPSPRTVQLLRRYDQLELWKRDPQRALENLQTVLVREPTAEKSYSVAELAYLAGKKIEPRDPQRALDLYGASVTHAYRYLFDEQFGPLRNPYDPQFRGACDLYNGALEDSLRIIKKMGQLLPGRASTIQTANETWDVTIVFRGGQWRAEDIERFEFVSDYEINGLTNHYQMYGLGVPLIAVRRSHPGEPAAARFYPPGLSFPVTAFLRVLPNAAPPGPDATGRRQALLELYDPLVESDITVGRLRVPLESDLSTPLAYFLDTPPLGEWATDGLFRPEKSKASTGLYMVQPYEPGKIPVLLVHGFWSSPMTWMEMFNDLRASPEIRAHYQFWFYLYPTGQPFWQSAAQLRDDLARARAVLDPRREEPALDEMVLVGHSMGGLIAKMQTIASGNDYWNIVSDKPFQLVKANLETRQAMAETFFFEPNPSIRRVIMISAPHRGSRFANDATRWLGRKMIGLPEMLVRSQQELYRDNPGVFRAPSLIDVHTSIDSMAPDSPILPVLLAARRPPWVKYHNIVGLVPDGGLMGTLAGGSDGVVTYASSHLDDADSELVVPADHSSIHLHPLTVLEVRRILLEHLAELRSFPNPPAPNLTAQRPAPGEPSAPVSVDARPQ
ncbi:MAG: esterase/lipase family protein [Pirellulales bacterium]